MSRFLNPMGVGVVHGQDDADGGLPRGRAGCRLGRTGPRSPPRDPQPRDLENPDVAPSRRFGSTAPKADLQKSTALPALATDRHGASLADQVMASVSR
jgi:hypothetical protein